MTDPVRVQMSDAETVAQALANVRRPDCGDEWTREHKGEFRGVEGYVWDCGDDICRCSRADLVAVFRNSKVRSCFVRISIYEGTFFSDGEPGADAELAALRLALAEHAPDLEVAVTWQAGVDYAAIVEPVTNGGAE